MAMRAQQDSWIDEAPERVTASREIAATPAAIWSVLADHEAWPDWFEGVREVRVTGPAEGVGARRRVKVPGISFDEEFVTWDVPERFAFTVVAASPELFAALAERVTLEDLGGGRTRITYTQAFEPKAWFRLPFKLAKRTFRSSLDKALKALARRVE